MIKAKHWGGIAITLLMFCAGYQQFYYTSAIIDNYLPSTLQSETKVLAMQYEDYVNTRANGSDTLDSPKRTSQANVSYALSLILPDESEVLVKDFQPTSLPKVPQWFYNLFSQKNTFLSHVFYIDQVKKGTLKTTLSSGPVIENSWNTFLALLGFYLVIMLVFYWVNYTQEKGYSSALSGLTSSINLLKKGKFSFVRAGSADGLFSSLFFEFNQLLNQLEIKDKQHVKEKEMLSYANQCDDLTGYAARGLFKEKINSLLSADNEFGHIILLRLVSLEVINKGLGFEEGDIYLSKVAKLIKKYCLTKDSSESVFRLNGRDFALILRSSSPEVVDDICEKLKSDLIANDNNEYKFGTAAFSIAQFKAGVSYKNLMSQLDLGLSEAMAQSDNSYVLTDETYLTGNNNEKWLNIVNKIIENKGITLAKQQLKHIEPDDNLYNFEVFAQFAVDGETYNARDVFSTAMRCSLLPSLEKIIVVKMASYYRESALTQARFLIKISYDSLLDLDFYYWLKQLLEKEPMVAKRSVFQIPEQAILRDITATKQFISMLNACGSKSCLDYEGSQHSYQLTRSIGELAVDMIKINGHYTRRINSHKDRSSFVANLISIAHSINVPVIASQVERTEESDALSVLGIDAVQGNLYGHVRPV